MPRPFMSEEAVERLLHYDPQTNRNQSPALYTQTTGSSASPAPPFTIDQINRLTGIDPEALSLYREAALALEFEQAAAGQGREDANLGSPDAFAGTARSFALGGANTQMTDTGTSGRADGPQTSPPPTPPPSASHSSQGANGSSGSNGSGASSGGGAAHTPNQEEREEDHDPYGPTSAEDPGEGSSEDDDAVLHPYATHMRQWNAAKDEAEQLGLASPYGIPTDQYWAYKGGKPGWMMADDQADGITAHNGQAGQGEETPNLYQEAFIQWQMEHDPLFYFSKAGMGLDTAQYDPASFQGGNYIPGLPQLPGRAMAWAGAAADVPYAGGSAGSALLNPGWFNSIPDDHFMTDEHGNIRYGQTVTRKWSTSIATPK